MDTISYDNARVLTGSGDFTTICNAQNGLSKVVTDGTLSLIRTFNSYWEVKGQSFTVNRNNISLWSLFHDNAGRITQKTDIINGTTSIYTYTYEELLQMHPVMW